MPKSGSQRRNKLPRPQTGCGAVSSTPTEPLQHCAALCSPSTLNGFKQKSEALLARAICIQTCVQVLVFSCYLSVALSICPLAGCVSFCLTSRLQLTSLPSFPQELTPSSTIFANTSCECGTCRQRDLISKPTQIKRENLGNESRRSALRFFGLFIPKIRNSNCFGCNAASLVTFARFTSTAVGNLEKQGQEKCRISIYKSTNGQNSLRFGAVVFSSEFKHRSRS